MKKIYIFSNDTEDSKNSELLLKEKLNSYKIKISQTITKDVSMIFCIGGDGTLLKLVQKLEFPTIPICGINTGHIGFFQEIDEDNLDQFLLNFVNDNIQIQPYNIVKAIITSNGNKIVRHALNEFVIRSCSNNLVHLNISINNSFIENFSGDGILVCSPAGSTAYNYSLSGSLVDPRLNLLQVTPIAPMNTKVYRSLTSSILLPQTDSLIIEPKDDRSTTLEILYDGEIEKYENVSKIELILSKRKINLVLYGDLTFWDKIKEKFL